MTLKLDDYIALIIFFLFVVCSFIYYSVIEITKESVTTGEWSKDEGKNETNK